MTDHIGHDKVGIHYQNKLIWQTSNFKDRDYQISPPFHPTIQFKSTMFESNKHHFLLQDPFPRSFGYFQVINTKETKGVSHSIQGIWYCLLFSELSWKRLFDLLWHLWPLISKIWSLLQSKGNLVNCTPLMVLSWSMQLGLSNGQY